MTRCPYCFRSLATSTQVFRCTSAFCLEEAHENPGQFSPAGMRGPLTSTSAFGPVLCKACHSVATQLACPRCGYDLPADWLAAETTCMVLAGPRTSGKGVYIAVLKKELEQLATMLGGSFAYASALTTLTYHEYYEKYIFEERRFMPSTAGLRDLDAQQREPLVFTLEGVKKRNHHIVIRDVAGEDLEDPDPKEDRAYVFDFSTLAGADVIVFLFDPMMIPSISDQLFGLVKAPPGRRVEPRHALNNLVMLMRKGEAAWVDKMSTPLALVVAKFDTLHELRKVDGSDWATILENVGAAINRDVSRDSIEYDDVDGELLEAEVESMFVKLGAQQLLNYARSTFSTVRLFAVSALGGPPSLANDINPRGLAPFRVLDPVLWTLQRSGLLESRKYL